jgi:hypothetical protein
MDDFAFAVNTTADSPCRQKERCGVASHIDEIFACDGEAG